jgi:hypothetical protein
MSKSLEYQSGEEVAESAEQLAEDREEILESQGEGLTMEYNGIHLGDSVKVLRTGGAIEGDWNFLGQGKNGRIIVEKYINGELMVKKISPSDFDKYQTLPLSNQHRAVAIKGEELARLRQLRAEISQGGSEKENGYAAEQSPELIATIRSAQSVEQLKALLENSEQGFEGANVNHIIASIGELQELSKKTKINGEAWSKRWNEIFDQESGGYSGSKEMTALRGKLNELFTKEAKEHKKNNSLGSRVKRFLGRGE